MKRRALLCLALLGLAACERERTPDPAAQRPAWPWSPGPVAPDAPRPAFEQVVLVTIDTLRADHLGCYGYPRRTSPFLDRLADQGVLFEDALSAISLTAPSHTTILTGLPPLLHGVYENGLRLAPDAGALPALFARRGFATGAFVSVQFLRGITDGFDQVAVERTGKLVPQVAEWVDSLGAEQPFFVWLHAYDPHHWNSPELTPQTERDALRAEFDGDVAGFYSLLARLHGLPDPPPDQPFEQAWPEELRQLQAFPRTRAAYLRHIDDYDAQIRYADGQLERLYRRLNELRPDRPTLWIVTADHGEGLGSHFYTGHGERIYNEQLRVPLILHATDGSLQPRRVAGLAEHIDLLPTLAELLGVPLEDPQGVLEGRSLWPALRGEPLGERTAFAQRQSRVSEDGLFALQSSRAKLLRYDSGRSEFYDLSADPLELRDLTQAGEERRRLEQELESRLARYRALAPPRAEGELPSEWEAELKKLGYH